MSCLCEYVAIATLLYTYNCRLIMLEYIIIYYYDVYNIMTLYIMYAFLHTGSLATPALIQLAQDDCGICTGGTLVYECTAVGIGNTVWSGSAFSQCAGNSIILSHSSFATSGTTGSCNSGEIVGYSVGVVGSSSYTSRLNVTVRESIIDHTVRCLYNDGARDIEIGEKTITIRQGTYSYIVIITIHALT